MIDLLFEFIFGLVGEIVFALADTYRRVTAYFISVALVAGGSWLLWLYRTQLGDIPAPAIVGGVFIVMGFTIASITAIAGSSVK